MSRGHSSPEHAAVKCSRYRLFPRKGTSSLSRCLVGRREMGQHQRPLPLGLGSSAENEWLFILEAGGHPHFFANPLSQAWLSLPLPPHRPPPSFNPLPQKTLSPQGPRVDCMPPSPGSWPLFLYVCSWQELPMIPTLHYTVLSPAISDGLMTNSSLLPERVSVGI